jgi:hypothetical protein
VQSTFRREEAEGREIAGGKEIAGRKEIAEFLTTEQTELAE